MDSTILISEKIDFATKAMPMEIDEDELGLPMSEPEPRRANSVKRRRSTIYVHQALPKRSNSMRLSRNEHSKIEENAKDDPPLDTESIPRRINSFKRRMQIPEENKGQEPAVKRTGSIKGYENFKIESSPSVNQQPETTSEGIRNRAGSLKKRMYRNSRSESAQNMNKISDFKNVLLNWKRKTEIILRDKLVHLGLAEGKSESPQCHDGKCHYCRKKSKTPHCVH